MAARISASVGGTYVRLRRKSRMSGSGTGEENLSFFTRLRAAELTMDRIAEKRRPLVDI